MRPKRITVELDESLYALLKQESLRRRIPMTRILRAGLYDFFDREQTRLPYHGGIQTGRRWRTPRA